eukprot:7390398-Prymnesium_polylepis.2
MRFGRQWRAGAVAREALKRRNLSHISDQARCCACGLCVPNGYQTANIPDQFGLLHPSQYRRWRFSTGQVNLGTLSHFQGPRDFVAACVENLGAMGSDLDRHRSTRHQHGPRASHRRLSFNGAPPGSKRSGAAVAVLPSTTNLRSRA